MKYAVSLMLLTLMLGLSAGCADQWIEVRGVIEAYGNPWIELPDQLDAGSPNTMTVLTYLGCGGVAGPTRVTVDDLIVTMWSA